jgi:equilibrative nucleoside transporter 1/2/3
MSPPSLQIDVLPPSDASLAAVLLLVALCGVCDGLAQGALFGEVALLPPRYTQALVAGTAASGELLAGRRVL